MNNTFGIGLFYGEFGGMASGSLTRFGVAGAAVMSSSVAYYD